jgi:uncharacterized MnhB-related membrane protein
MATTTSTINEFLVRWDESGNLQGAHLANLTTFTADDGSVRRWMEAPRPVALTDATLLASISSTLNTSALSAVTQAQADRDAAIAARDAAVSQLNTLQTQLAQQGQVIAEINGVPQSVERRFGMKALILSGLLSKVLAAIAAIPDATQRALAQADFESSPTFDRNDPSVLNLCQMAAISSEEADDLFILAGRLQRGEIVGELAAPTDTSSTGVIAWIKNLLGLS